jgi:hypothetical protein
MIRFYMAITKSMRHDRQIAKGEHPFPFKSRFTARLRRTDVAICRRLLFLVTCKAFCPDFPLWRCHCDCWSLENGGRTGKITKEQRPTKLQNKRPFCVVRKRQHRMVSYHQFAQALEFDRNVGISPTIGHFIDLILNL